MPHRANERGHLDYEVDGYERIMSAFYENQFLWAGALLGAGLTAVAAPLRSADVPAEPMWVLHVDCDALRPTSVGHYLIGEMEKPDAQGQLAAFQTLFSFDPRKELHGLTLYSSSNAPDDGLLLVYADFDPERLVTLAKAAKDSQSTPYKAHVIYNWLDQRKQAANGVPPRTYAAIAGKRLVVFGQQEKRVAEALDVLDQATPNLAASKALANLGTTGNGCFIEASARKLKLADSTPTAAVARLAKSLSLRVGETNRQVTATLSMEANDEGIATQAATVVQGLLAMVRLQKDKPEAGRLAEALSLKQAGATVVATLVMPAAEVVGLLRTETEKKARQEPEKN
jgi:hypothetical protein